MAASTANFDVDDPRYRITPAEQMLSSCVGAMMTSLFMTPLDVVKIRLQAQQKAMLSNKCFIYCNGLMDHLCPCLNGNGKSATTVSAEQWYRRPGHFNGTLDAFVKIARHEGISSLWSGLSPTLVLAVPSTVIYFTTYEQLRLYLKDRCLKGVPDKTQPLWIPLVSGATARTWAVMIVSPLELVRTKMQSKKLSYLEISVAVRELVQSQGWRSLWRGLPPSLLRDVPFSALYWSGYETYKRLVPTSNPTFWYNFGGGALAGTFAAVLTLPFDVVKTHRQIELGEQEIYAEKPGKASTTREIIRRIYLQRGVQGLFAGIVPRVVKVAPACAMMIASYEYAKLFFSRYNQRKLAQRESF